MMFGGPWWSLVLGGPWSLVVLGGPWCNDITYLIQIQTEKYLLGGTFNSNNRKWTRTFHVCQKHSQNTDRISVHILYFCNKVWKWNSLAMSAGILNIETLY